MAQNTARIEKNNWFSSEVLEEIWDARQKIEVPSSKSEFNAFQLKLIYDFIAMQAGQIAGSAKTIIRCAAILRNPDNSNELLFDESWFERNLQEFPSAGIQVKNNVQSLPENLVVLPNLRSFREPLSETAKVYFTFLSNCMMQSSQNNCEKLSYQLSVVPQLAATCLRCVVKNPTSVRYHFKKLAIFWANTNAVPGIHNNYKFVPPLSENLLNALESLSLEDPEAKSVWMMYLKFVKFSSPTENQISFINEYVLSPVKGTGIQLAWTFYCAAKHLEHTAQDLLHSLETIFHNSKIRKSIQLLREFILKYDNELVNDNNHLIWWCRLVDSDLMKEFAAIKNRYLIQYLCGSTGDKSSEYIHVYRNIRNESLKEVLKEFTHLMGLTTNFSCSKYRDVLERMQLDVNVVSQIKEAEKAEAKLKLKMLGLLNFNH